ncbi:bifunctional phosphopantothenoylcysteine decarboxylase/phosphopantothenate--cysteine ligase CoaBC [Georgenia faecalis]|uniref:Coenzyme A biosynthesis bifunctional protein CoaBC n=1 Tax=Georgenia faecalis TaxID=2483799 RepID=A0ABV9DA51_9MICO|nr:bifunctional phosphopantothenoylcysteine decarboxylase/phosphopantothenate--cysteine ligase CoaBC [Georgenia faecalis]
MTARIVLGVSGGIAAYKAVLLLRLLREAGHRVRVVPTAGALEFVGRSTWEALSGEPVHTDVFAGAVEVEHVALGRSADLVIVAPATADLLARAAAGRADDLLTATLLTVTCPVLLAPAMHTEMWHHPATVDNVATLRARGTRVLEPDDGRLTGADTGPGRLPEPERIAAAALALLGPADLAGRRVVVTAGGTREPLDPVRFLGNRSSGRQGAALAAEAARRGADVRLLAASVDEVARRTATAAGVAVTDVTTTAELRDAVRAAVADADVLVMAAAVADFRPAAPATGKIKKDGGAPPTLTLVENPDILAEVAADRPHPRLVVVGFAAETGEPEEVLALGRAKARRKGADLLAVNAVGTDRGFGDVTNAITVLDADGEVVGSGAGTKAEVAATLWDLVADRLR